jgi:outer membrane protein OmpA-like peptidoglycan-associated protein
VAPGTVTTFGLGEGDPVVPNERPDGSDDPDGRQRNRRVEILVTPLP